MSMLWRRSSLALALAFGLGASQAPEFGQQYFQRLGGAIDEITGQLAAFDSDSQALGLNRAEGVAHLRAASDSLAQSRGDRLAQDADRLEHLRRQQDAMRGGAPLTKLRIALADPDPRVARGAFDDFEPALPLTSDGAICAAGGFAGLLILLRLMGMSFRRRREKGLAKVRAN
jgi:hypothetical protein